MCVFHVLGVLSIYDLAFSLSSLLSAYAAALWQLSCQGSDVVGRLEICGQHLLLAGTAKAFPSVISFDTPILQPHSNATPFSRMTLRVTRGQDLLFLERQHDCAMPTGIVLL